MRNKIIKDMSVWMKYGTAKNVKSRTKEQRAWDSAVLAVSEYVRRRTGDENFSLELHGLLIPSEPHNKG
jgi:hypothetical protein